MTLNFALFYAGDAYSTDRKIMGRQSAGKSLIRGLARSFPNSPLHALGTAPAGLQGLKRQLGASGHQGDIHWSLLPGLGSAAACGSLYFPGPPTRELAAARNADDPLAFSLMGVTHTVASKAATDAIADLILPPFKPWDALICTSTAARSFAHSLHEDMRRYWQEHTGANRFNEVVTPVIPLGVNTDDFAVDRSDGTVTASQTTGAHAAESRKALGLAPTDVVFLFAGRLTFHAKANPAPTYQALQALSATAGCRLVCLEAGVHPNEAVAESYRVAQRTLAPDVHFVWVDGNDAAAYRQAWQAADVFLSISDNIQETFGLTPVEAMAAGLPVVVSDWNGYKDTVRHGVDGFRVAAITPPPGAGQDLARMHALDVDSYDFYIGRTSLATVVDPAGLQTALATLIQNPELRRRMGQSGALRARTTFDWQAVLPQYQALAEELSAIRRQAREGARAHAPHAWPLRGDPFQRFVHFPSAVLQGGWLVALEPDAAQRLQTLTELQMSRYGLHGKLLPQEHLEQLVGVLRTRGTVSVSTLLQAAGLSTGPGVRALMWLWKFAVVRVGATASSR